MKSMIHSWKKKAAQYRELKKQKGVTLLEIIIVLGIIGIIAAGVVILAQRAFASQDMTDVVDNSNTIRVSMTEVYRDANGYPGSSSLAGITKAQLDADKTATSPSYPGPVLTMLKMGKLTSSEAFNNFSNEPFEIGPAGIGATADKPKGFYIAVNGLSQEECRNLISQTGSEWDYVETQIVAAGSNTSYLVAPAISPDIAVPTLLMGVEPSGSIVKTLKKDTLTPDIITGATVCTDQGSANAVILGSR
ncbi:type IV pilus major pilin [Citrobacter braakii]|uniref:type IV pilus major pilin n=1 Tax=Citrobacter braakii TaxID=57706 RepID=UPI000CDD5EAF|nr:type IV pilus major pilin [Citrobacter braakii]POT33149.1 type IV pilin [Citrobacter braakii]POT37978.1 type IV pilin [Citrobacter braakii]POT43414.1 type IV pilin [Citrobacter braakii]POT64164.1 type IV pilin [Citrobacter braakii]POU83594.1 type IV pilin [Citrobacter braakii]